MSFIKNFFWPPKPPAPIQDLQDRVTQTIHRLKESLGTLTSREIGFQKDIEINRNEAKRRLKLNDERNAMLYMSKVKILEKNLTDTVSNKLNVSAQIFTLQNSSFTNQLVSNMEETRETFRIVSQNRDPEYIQSLVRDVTGEMNKAALIQSAISGPFMDITDVQGDLDILRGELDQDNEREIDLAFLRMPSAPIRPVEFSQTPLQVASSGEVSQRINNPVILQRNSEQMRPEEHCIRQVIGARALPRTIKIVDGKIKDSHCI